MRATAGVGTPVIVDDSPLVTSSPAQVEALGGNAVLLKSRSTSPISSPSPCDSSRAAVESRSAERCTTESAFQELNVARTRIRGVVPSQRLAAPP